MSFEQQKELSSGKQKDLRFRGWRRHPSSSSSNFFHQK